MGKQSGRDFDRQGRRVVPSDISVGRRLPKSGEGRPIGEDTNN